MVCATTSGLSRCIVPRWVTGCLDWLLASLQANQLAITIWRSEALLSCPLGVKTWHYADVNGEDGRPQLRNRASMMWRYSHVHCLVSRMGSGYGYGADFRWWMLTPPEPTYGAYENLRASVNDSTRT
uniref:Uncharacterized protein n=1 Tax=Hyaloperonospora arabidopsidis (strain Emoy2) TaxID=559515 RepID=M4BFV3_HYAAE